VYDPLFTDFFANVFSWVMTAVVVGIILLSVAARTPAVDPLTPSAEYVSAGALGTSHTTA
jgi:hypothetical protein